MGISMSTVVASMGFDLGAITASVLILQSRLPWTDDPEVLKNPK
jgi:hypothetical protein